ncbi:MAG: hypothetical protein C4326_14600 [Ignavibacteria bacterium]
MQRDADLGSEGGRHLKRSLGSFDVVMLGIGAIIGGGISYVVIHLAADGTRFRQQIDVIRNADSREGRVAQLRPEPSHRLHMGSLYVPLVANVLPIASASCAFHASKYCFAMSQYAILIPHSVDV